MGGNNTMKQRKVIRPHQPEYIDVCKYMRSETLLSPEDEAFRLKCREIAEEMRDHVIDANDKTVNHPKILELCKKLGPAGLMIDSTTIEGAPGYSYMKCCLLAFELARVDVSFATFYLVHSGLAMAAIYASGNDEQKKRLLKPMLNYDKIGAFGLTEPLNGSDATKITTTAKKVDGGWSLHGEKRWIGNGTFADYIVIFAKNLESKQVEGFVIDRNCSKPETFITNKIERKYSLRAVQNAHIIMNDAFVPEHNRLSGAGGFYDSLGPVLLASRGVVGCVAAGLCVNAYELSAKYTYDRIQFGKPIIGKQLVQERQMRLLGIAQACVLQMIHLGTLMDKGLAGMEHHAMVKGTITRMARDGVRLARENLGGNGIVMDYLVILPFLDVEATYTYEGTYDINMLLTGRILSGQNAIT